MVRGIERTALFRDETDRTDFVARLAALAAQGAWTLYAWALLPNHAHLLVRTGRRSLPRSMRALLTGYAGAFNRRHRRGGHLFQNRYKSIVVEEDPYLLELVRYLHLTFKGDVAFGHSSYYPPGSHAAPTPLGCASAVRPEPSAGHPPPRDGAGTRNSGDTISNWRSSGAEVVGDLARIARVAALRGPHRLT
jgi:REP element-mobilizing transposase RayT